MTLTGKNATLTTVVMPAIGNSLFNTLIDDLALPYRRSPVTCQLAQLEYQNAPYILLQAVPQRGIASMTTDAEYICPQIAQRLNLDFTSTTFIECYEPPMNFQEHDSTFEVIEFDDVPLVDEFTPDTANPLARATIKCWRALSIHDITAMEHGGIALTQHLGKQGLFKMPHCNRLQAYKIALYDGKQYYCASTQSVIPGLLVSTRPASVPDSNEYDANE